MVSRVAETIPLLTQALPQVMAYAAHAGGILCMELLHQSFIDSHPCDANVTRSAIVQQLSLLVGFLDWVGPLAPNSILSANCSRVIQHVLDHTLNGTGARLPELIDDVQLDFDFELLDTFEWLRPEWGREVSVHP